MRKNNLPTYCFADTRIANTKMYKTIQWCKKRSVESLNFIFNYFLFHLKATLYMIFNKQIVISTSENVTNSISNCLKP